MKRSIFRQIKKIFAKDNALQKKTLNKFNNSPDAKAIIEEIKNARCVYSDGKVSPHEPSLIEQMCYRYTKNA